MSENAVDNTQAPKALVRWKFFAKNQQLGVQVAIRDEPLHTLYLHVGLPWLVGLTVLLSFTPNRLTRWLAGGAGEMAHYGLLVCEYEVKCQWRKILDLPGKAGGWEWRRTWTQLLGEPQVRSVLEWDSPLGFALSATAKVPFQHVRIQVSKVKVTTRYPAKWLPTFWHTYYTVRIDEPVRNAQGEPTTVRWKHYRDMGHLSRVMDAFAEDLREELGFA